MQLSNSQEEIFTGKSHFIHLFWQKKLCGKNILKEQEEDL